MSEREQVDTGDLVREFRGDLQAITAQIEGLGALMKAENGSVRREIEGLREQVGEIGKMSKRALATQSEHREAHLQHVHGVESGLRDVVHELEQRFEERMREADGRVGRIEVALAKRSAPSMTAGWSPLKRALITLLVALAALASSAVSGGLTASEVAKEARR